MAERYQFFNGPMPTTAALVKVTTGTAIKTLLQIKSGTQSKLEVVEWGISFDASAAATPIECELIETGTVFATVTAFVAADIVKLGDPNGVDPTTSLFAVGVSASGYTASAEGTVVASRLFDYQQVSPTGGYVKQFPLGERPVFNVGSSLRVRTTTAVAANAICYVTLSPS